MDNFWLSYFAAGKILNLTVSVLLQSCPKDWEQTEQHTGERYDHNDQSVFQDSQTEGALAGIAEVFHKIFGSQESEPVARATHSKNNRCQSVIDASVGGVVFSSTLWVVLVTVVTLCLAVMLSIKIWTTAFNNRSKSESGSSKEALEQTDKKEKEIVVNTIGAVPEKKEGGSDEVVAQPVIINNYVNTNNSAWSARSINCLSRPDGCQFLTFTIDHLHTQLDWLLGLSTAADQSASLTETTSSSVYATPGVVRKGSIRRPKWRTGGGGRVAGGEGKGVRMWQHVRETERRMDWRQLDVGDLDINAVTQPSLSALLQFYQQTCPVPAQQWTAACLIVNYTLTLLRHQINAAASDRQPLRLLELRSFGSAANQTCISRADRFNVMMVVQPTSCGETTVYHGGVCDDIPAGRVVLGVKEAPSAFSPSSRMTSPLLEKDRVGEAFGLFLSHREVVQAAQKVVVNALEKLRLTDRILLDRLPFSVSLDQYTDLVLCLDTSALGPLGLGLSKITIRLTPAIRVSPQDANPLPVLYAVPPWTATSRDNASQTRSRIQSRIMRNPNQGVSPDLLWQLDCSEVTRCFMDVSDVKPAAGFNSRECAVMCQQILRALFSRCGKDSLLSMGEVAPFVLDAVVAFLLLESSPSAWTLATLPERLSDSVHFLRSALQSCWMPSFAVHNPRLLKRMPALSMLPLLGTPRQENLLGVVSADTVEIALTHLEHRLQETGLTRCMKDEFSTEMWEYEFFLFG